MFILYFSLFFLVLQILVIVKSQEKNFLFVLKLLSFIKKGEKKKKNVKKKKKIFRKRKKILIIY
jgi:hypothetical protein